MTKKDSDSEPTVQRLFDLTGKVALVTGGTGHLGGALARALAEAGATVAISSRGRDRATEAASALASVREAGHFGVELDQLDESSIERAFRQVMERAGRLDVLVNNAQDSVGRGWTDVSGEDFRHELANAAGYFLLGRHFRDHVSERGGTGSLVLLGSMYGLVGSYPDAYEGICPPSSVAYHTLKGGIIHLTRHLAVYWAGDGVRVNCLSPGPFPSPKAPREMVDRLETKSPMKRMGEPYELKGAIVFLASDASGYMTGQNLVIDGGWTAW